MAFGLGAAFLILLALTFWRLLDVDHERRRIVEQTQMFPQVVDGSTERNAALGAMLKNFNRSQEHLVGEFFHIAYGFGTALLVLFGLAVWHAQRRRRRWQETTCEREKLVGQLREAEMKYRSIFDNAIEGIFQTTPDGRFVTANRALARMYGYDSPERLMESLTDVATQLYIDPSQRRALLEALRHEDVVSNFEFEVVRADGRTMWVRENVHAIRDQDGQLLYLEGTVEDVSDVWWGEQRRRLQYATSRVLGDAATVEEARPRILETICKALEWDIGLVWEVREGEMRGGIL